MLWNSNFAAEHAHITEEDKADKEEKKNTWLRQNDKLDVNTCHAKRLRVAIARFHKFVAAITCQRHYYHFNGECQR